MRWLWIVLLAACGSASGQANAPEGEADAPESGAAQVVSVTATRVEVAEVAPSAAQIRMRLPGEVEGSRDAMLSSALGGFVERVHVSEGDEVRSGQVLVRVDSSLHGARAAQARVEVEAAERELRRAESLEGSIATAQIDNARSRRDAARAALRTAQVTASRALIKAPFDGIIAQLDVERGEVTGPGRPLARLIQLNPAHVSLSVPDRDVVALQVGAEVTVQTTASGVLQGRVSRVSPAADLSTRAFEVEVEVPNADGQVLPGMIAQVEFNQPVATGRILLPQYVLVTRLEGNGVFVADGDEARWVAVETGQVVRDQVVIESGLSGGEQVIVTGHRELAEGDAIMVVREGTCCTEGRVVFGGEEG